MDGRFPRDGCPIKIIVETDVLHMLPAIYSFGRFLLGVLQFESLIDFAFVICGKLLGVVWLVLPTNAPML